MKGINNISQENLKYSYRPKKLPHIFDLDKAIFITYRLNFTLPKQIMESMKQRKEDWLSKYQAIEGDEKLMMMKRKDSIFFNWFDELIAKSIDVPQLLHREDLTNIIKESFHHFDNIRYHLIAYCIMPNHVHVVILPKELTDNEIYSPSHITYTWKKYTAFRINALLKQNGSLWQHESYDHLIKSDNELYHTLEYIIDNPVKAGLVTNWEEWHGTWIRDDLKPVG